MTFKLEIINLGLRGNQRNFNLLRSQTAVTRHLINPEHVVTILDFKEKLRYLIALWNSTSLDDSADSNEGLVALELSLGHQYLRFKPFLDEQVSIQKFRS